jgi:alkylhydroperoxidase/carboxymuconolactone decarboxylase family protein YurZ
MSKALDYLLKARPEAMQAYFTFLKKAGEHLDPKTAALISVITKVHAKTANGVRQYLPRALKAGASADEVIDALLMAMPALGFSKIVWAIDVIIEMNLPEFVHLGKPAAPSSATETWHEVAPLASLKEGDSKYFPGRLASCNSDAEFRQSCRLRCALSAQG